MRTEIEKKKDNRALYLAGERKEGKKNNLRRRSDHHTSSRACVTSCGRGHDDASKETTKGEVWPLDGVTCTF
jgi:hypothetical protein